MKIHINEVTRLYQKHLLARFYYSNMNIYMVLKVVQIFKKIMLKKRSHYRYSLKNGIKYYIATIYSFTTSRKFYFRYFLLK